MRFSDIPTVHPYGELKIYKKVAAYTYRSPGIYYLAVPPGLEVRISMQGGMGGGGGAGFSIGGQHGQGGGSIVPGSPGKPGEYVDLGWRDSSDFGGNPIKITVGAGGEGGHGVSGLDGGKGLDGWAKVEIRTPSLLTKARLIFRTTLWQPIRTVIARISKRLTWNKSGVLLTGIAVLIGAATLLVTVCNQ